MTAMHVFRYATECASNDDVGHDASALIAPSDALRETGYFFFLSPMGNFSTHNLVTSVHASSNYDVLSFSAYIATRLYYTTISTSFISRFLKNFRLWSEVRSEFTAHSSASVLSPSNRWHASATLMHGP